MPRIVRGGLIQCSNPVNDETRDIATIQKAMFEKHLPFIEDAGKRGVQILCLQEIFNGPYFCPSQSARWYDAAEPVPGPTVEALAPYAKKHRMVLIVPVYEREKAGVYYNTAAVIDADGTYLGKYRKTHIPQANPATGEVIEAAPLTKREKLMARIVDVEQEATELGLRIDPAKPLDQMSDEELLDHGVNLRRAIEMEQSVMAKEAA